MSRGHKRSTEQWRALIAAQRQSGQTIEAFCAAHGVGESTFGKWKRRLAIGMTHAVATPASPAAPLFAPLALTPVTLPAAETQVGAGGWTIELDLGAGVCLRLRPAR